MLSIQDQIEKKICDLKNPSDHHSITRLSVKDKGLIRAYLRPVPSILIGEAENDAFLMAIWRNKSPNSFLTSFHATKEKTELWLGNYYADNYTDIIFMIETLEHVPFGHLALYNFDFDHLKCEFGRILRGSNEGPKGGMTIASKTLLHWAFHELKMERIFLEVFEDNISAIPLYKKLNFRRVQRIPLQLVDEGEEKKWIKIDSSSFDYTKPERFALEMVKEFE